MNKKDRAKLVQELADEMERRHQMVIVPTVWIQPYYPNWYWQYPTTINSGTNTTFTITGGTDPDPNDSYVLAS